MQVSNEFGLLIRLVPYALYDKSFGARLLKWAVLLGLIGYGGILACAAAEDLPPIYLDGFVDRRARETKVSGRSLIGAVALDESASDIASPALVFPSSVLQSPMPQCVETVSVDGSYWSQGQIPADTLRSGLTRIRIRYGDPKKPKEEREIAGILNEFGQLNVAVLITVGSCLDEAPANSIIVARRQSIPLPEIKGVRLFINSKKDTAEVAYTDLLGASKKANCKRTPEGRQRIVYDTICDMVGPLKESTLIKLTLIHYEQRLPSLDYVLLTGRTAEQR